MSPNIGNFVHDLVEMAKAMETLPQVQAELASTANQLDGAHEAIKDRELRILGLKTEIEEMNAKLRSAEAAREDAEFAFLEADDRTQRALAFVKTTFGNAGALIQALEPAKPADAGVQVQAVPEVAPGEVKPIDDGSYTDDPRLGVPMHEAQLEGSYFKPVRAPDGMADFDPTPQPQDQSESPFSTAVGPTVDAQAGVTAQETSTNPEPGPAIGEAKPWAGMKWSDAHDDNLNPPYSYNAWIAGGGLSSDFNR